MSRFNSEAYDKLFPRVADPIPAPETAVEHFTPTKDKMEGRNPDHVDDPTDQAAAPEDPDVNGGVDDGYAEPSELDPEQ